LTTLPWRIVFFGTPTFALPTLQTLFERPDEVVAVVTQPDREKGRGRRVVFSPVKELALRHHLTLLQPERVKEELFQEALIGLHPDLVVVVAFGQILPKSILNIPKYGAINVHASLLPKYRGAAPIAWAILNGEKVTGITTMVMDEGMDTGDILLQVETTIENEEMCETKATYAPPLKKEDGHIDWRKGANEINRQVRAFNPWPGAFTKLGNQWLKIYKGEIRERPLTGKAGAVVWVGSDFIEVETGKDSFRIKEVQLEGRRRMTIRDFLSGHPLPVGTVFH